MSRTLLDNSSGYDNIEKTNKVIMKKYKIPECFLGQKPIIYFLYQRDELVYIGSSKNGLQRAMDHLLDKEFDFLSFVDAPENKELRRAKEENLIYKHKPKYNSIYAWTAKTKKADAEVTRMWNEGFSRAEIAKEIGTSSTTVFNIIARLKKSGVKLNRKTALQIAVELIKAQSPTQDHIAS
jgi:DNA-binding NarL/FixJ family response regulator